MLAAQSAWAFGEGTLFDMERRRDQFSHDFGYFIYPISGSVPGLGTAYGGGATVTNIAETDTDFTGFYITGDFEASGAAILNYHLIDERLILDVANYTAKVAPKQYNRGMDSSKDDFILPKVESEMAVAQLTYTVFDRMFEFYLRGGVGSQRLMNVYDSSGNEFSNADKSKTYFQALAIGFGLDVTDDRQDPRRGVRYEMKDRMIFAEYGDSSAFDVLDANLTYYHPVGESSTWVFNAYYSTALMRKKG
ncbi:MAG: BamA/TamA family outer membrane protein, partial [Nitrospinota bacterium]|nr:BamA/TamA family outer membrane protein [Nitrospinota bacterium]